MKTQSLVANIKTADTYHKFIL